LITQEKKEKFCGTPPAPTLIEKKGDIYTTATRLARELTQSTSWALFRSTQSHFRNKETKNLYHHRLVKGRRKVKPCQRKTDSSSEISAHTLLCEARRRRRGSKQNSLNMTSPYTAINEKERALHGTGKYTLSRDRVVTLQNVPALNDL